MLNKTIIQGRLTRDPELRHTGSGTPVASFTVAWSEKYKETEQKMFLPCVAWRNSAEFVSKYFTKGQEIAVEGKLTSRKWQDKDGNSRETIELVADQLHFCGSKPASGGQQAYPAPPTPQYGGYAYPAPAQMSDQEYALMEGEDEGLPF